MNTPLAGARPRVLSPFRALLEAFGTTLLSLGADFQVVQASAGLDELLGAGAGRAALGKGAEEMLGADLFGPQGVAAVSLAAGGRQEDLLATLEIPGLGSRRVKVSAAPLPPGATADWDPRARYLVLLRPADEKAVERRVPEATEADSKAPVDFCGLVARSPSMRKVFALIERLAESDATVLVTGESGTGKELVARALHQHSPRAAGPFVAVNSAALPAELLESELFGHVRGSFTGAVRDRVGRFEMAAGGTLFLDEVGDVPLPLQVKLLRVLQERAFERVGEGRPRPTDARIVAATNVDLQRAVAEGRFRGDLFYRLRVVPIEIPPLRERREDVEPIASALLVRINARRGRTLRFDPALPAALSAYDWPGNVRELENAVEFAAAVSSGPLLHLHDLPPEVQNRSVAAPAPAAPGARLEGGSAIDREERERLQAVLAAHQWRRQDAAQALGLSRSTLWRKMRELGLAG